MATSTAISLKEYSSPSRGQLPRRIPPAPYRHAAPCGPWPWQNLDDPIPPTETKPNVVHRSHNGVDWDPECDGCHWSNYPESLYPNWKRDQVERSKMITTFPESGTTTIYQIDIDGQGHFDDKGKQEVVHDDWEKFQQVVGEPSKEHRLRAFFFDNLTVSVMQMVGTKYNVEPFFWTSSVNWIPARYQESSKHGIGDHITITLKFPRTVPLDNQLPLTDSERNLAVGEIIDTQRPLPLTDHEHQKVILIIDYLAVHMIRDINGSTLLTYHPAGEWKATTAANLHTRVYLAGQSVYWQKIFHRSSDPTFMFLATLWYSLYAWDEAFETLWEHICLLESEVIHTNESKLTHELHKIRAHLLHYASLLEDFYQAVVFVRDTANPAMEADSHSHEKKSSCELLKTECENLLMQIDRLKKNRITWDSRLQNVMHLVFSTVNIQDSKQMQELTIAAVRDSAAMKQISYLTMVFLPASFIAGCFGMNIGEINPGTFGTLGHYFAAAVPLTVLTIWIFVAYQGDWHSGAGFEGLMFRFMWPYVYVKRYIGRWRTPSGSDTTAV